MYVVSASSDDAVIAPIPDGLDYGVPCVFDGCRGIYHPGRGPIGVVLCAPWGFEDLSMRKGWRLLAEAIAAAGYPCMRFDYPGTGDSLGRSTEVTSIDCWTGSIGTAADTLRKLSGVRGFVFVGQSLGATLAVLAARGRRDVVGLQLVAPVVKGRAHVRELSVTATMVADRIGIATDLEPDEGLSVVGFPLSPAMVDDLKKVDLTTVRDLHVADVTRVRSGRSKSRRARRGTPAWSRGKGRSERDAAVPCDDLGRFGDPAAAGRSRRDPGSASRPAPGGPVDGRATVPRTPVVTGRRDVQRGADALRPRTTPCSACGALPNARARASLR